MSAFQVSVIIPVYNAVKYVRKAVDSALHLPEVKEILLIDDAYPDGAIDVCRQLERTDEKVKLLTHPGHVNRGPGASRNLGLRNASSEYVAFLDADDWYRPNRFTETKAIFSADPSVDGVYAPVGTFFYGDELKMFGRLKKKEEGDRHITFLREETTSSQLFTTLVRMEAGSTIHTNGITLKKSLLEKTGLFDESLKLHQDIHLWVRCAYYGKLVGVTGKEVVAIRGVHGENRINAINIKSKTLYYQSLYNFFADKKLDSTQRRAVERKYLSLHPRRRFARSNLVLRNAEMVILWVSLRLKLIS